MKKLIFTTRTGKKYHDALAEKYFKHGIQHTQWEVWKDEEAAKKAGYTATATPSATPTNTPTGGGDGKSDGLSSCPERTQAPKTTVPAGSPATGRG